VKVFQKENRAAKQIGLGAPLGCLDSALTLLGAIGAAMDCYDTALRYAKKEFSLTSLLQDTVTTKEILAEMITEITKAIIAYMETRCSEK
jgi:glutaryl-CoA dehydrogenase